VRVTFLPLLVNAPAEYPKTDENKASNEVLLHEQGTYTCALPGASPPPHKTLLFCPLAGQGRHLKWWLTKDFADHLDISYIYAGMGNNEHTEMQLQFQDLPNPSIFATTPKVGGTGLTLTAADHAVITEKFRVMNGQSLAFASVIRLGQNRAPHTWQVNTGPSAYDNGPSDLHLLPAVAHMRVLHGLMS